MVCSVGLGMDVWTTWATPEWRVLAVYQKVRKNHTGDIVPAINGPPLVEQTGIQGGIVFIRHYGLRFLPTYLVRVRPAWQRLGGEILGFVTLLWEMKRNH